jgi:hypothetical protein
MKGREESNLEEEGIVLKYMVKKSVFSPVTCQFGGRTYEQY